MTQYYQIQHKTPALVHRFYQDISKFGRPEEDGTMSVTTTMRVYISSFELILCVRGCVFVVLIVFLSCI